ncbi:hypothetical protein [Pseudomonas sp. W2-17]|uniref:hypothetical protein n=1 Tax=Pseudomonas sp. W2-17 TaxID=3058039 RepID=UPI0034E0AD5E
MTVNDEIQAALACPSSSLWLRNALTSALGRDSVDAANDAERLSELLSRRCDWLWRSMPVIEEEAHDSSL